MLHLLKLVLFDPITATPTQMNFIYEEIQRTLHIMKELSLDYIFLEVDQEIYSQVLDMIFKLNTEGYIF